VGDAEPRKNLPLLLDAYALYRRGHDDARELVLAGSASAAAPGVRVESRPGPDRLAELYAGAIALVHPSLHEGFGLTPLEAMSLGTPVVAVRSAAVLEVCADAARYVDPHDSVGLADVMAELAGSDKLQREMADHGRARAAKFSWAASARAHAAAYSLALEPR
jgi:glycosyltransferase involved in cell wall biosynthesis